MRATAVLLSWLVSPFAASAAEPWLEWKSLPDLPDKLGVAGAFVGVSNGALVVAGGSNFPVSKWEGGEKVYRDAIYVLEPGAKAWKPAGRLPRALASGAAVSLGDRMVCLGGRDQDACYAEVFSIAWNKANGEVRIEKLSDMPIANYELAAAAIEKDVYVSAGRNDEQELNEFWRLPSATSAQKSWEKLPNGPASARYGAALVAQSNGERQCLYLIGGKQATNYLSDVYRFDPLSADSAWKPCALLPRPSFLPAVAVCGQSHLLLFGGSTGADLDRIGVLKDKYRFPKQILAYHTITDTWTSAGEMPEGLAAASAVSFDDGLAIPSGEISPGLRTAHCFGAQLKASASTFRAIDYGVLGIYFLGIAALSAYCTRRNNSTEQFFLGGRRIPWWAAGLSLLATQISAIGILAIPAKSYATNWVYLLGIVTWFIVVPVVNRAYIPFFRKLNVTSAYEYLEYRFSPGLRMFGSISFCLLQLGRMAVVLYLPSIVLVAITGIEVVPAVLLMGLLCTVYTVAGGMDAVIWTEVVEAVTLLLGVFVCLAVVLFQLDGGVQELVSVAQTHDKLRLAHWGWDAASATIGVVLIGNIFTRLSNLTSDQSCVQRYLTTPNERTAKLALWTDVAVSIPWAILVFSLGTAIFVFYQSHPEKLHPAVQADGIVPFFISNQLPAGIAGLVVSAIMISAMSSMESSMHAIATLCVTDFYGRLKPEASDKARLRTARTITLLLGLFGTGAALVLATANVMSLWDLFQYLMGLFVGSLAGLFMLGIFTRRANSTGAWVGAIASVAALAVVSWTGTVHFLMFSTVGVATCFCSGYLASLIVPDYGQTHGLTLRPRETATHHS